MSSRSEAVNDHINDSMNEPTNGSVNDPANDPYKLIKLAEKKLREKSWFGKLSSYRYEKACDLYIKAGNILKGARKWEDAGSAFMEAGELYIKLENLGEATQQFQNAAKCLTKINPKMAIDLYKRCAGILRDDGRISFAASMESTIGKLYLTCFTDRSNASIHYKIAAQMYLDEDQKAWSNENTLKAAEIDAELGEYRMAMKGFEQASKNSRSTPSGKFFIEKYLLKACLCCFCLDDYIEAEKKISSYVEKYKCFSDSREYNFVIKILESLKNHDLDGFNNVLVEYDSLTKFTEWEVDLLLLIKDIVKKEPSLT